MSKSISLSQIFFDTKLKCSLLTGKYLLKLITPLHISDCVDFLYASST